MNLRTRVRAAHEVRRTRKNVETAMTFASLVVVAGLLLAFTKPAIRAFGRWCYGLAGGFLGAVPGSAERPVRDFLEGENGRLLTGGIAIAALAVLAVSAVLGAVARRRNRVVADRVL